MGRNCVSSSIIRHQCNAFDDDGVEFFALPFHIH